ncbi:ThiF family adenylyltransferase (plasmid) [Actinacidiphila glaucinigra]|uniref:HesA/MoeB/ThiF family protein n=1 Tax=Actinacidiphila glaucinigra TaxID=235986 RepID=UPI002DDBE6DE|nr:ThiF family adenylyltransferase [Actinacidiphila glaucinigra]WSD65749.1 ThiF family adenylyltransferase [Actinacidiphila glaucinigra]WSD65963.1 ThiF family adenylyltransferase [Actinacidiphila glaucinigra]
MQLPRVRPEHGAYRTTDGRIRLGSGVYGLATEITDGPPWLWDLLTAADGTRTPQQIADTVRALHPEAAAEDVFTALDDLIQAGHMDDAAAWPPPDFTEREQDRYGRSVAYWRWTDPQPRASAWDVQRILRSAKVVVVGVGGTGGAAATALAASGIGRLHLVDHDRVELSNLNRQTLFRERDITRLKVDAARDRLHQTNSDITVTGQRSRITSPDDLAEILPGFDLLMMCADQPDDIRTWANEACLKANLPWIDGGYHGPLVTVGAYAPHISGGCRMCLRRTEDERWQPDIADDTDLIKTLPRAPGHPATAITAGLSGQLAAHLAIALLTGTAAVTPGTIYGINLAALGTDPVHLTSQRRPDCPACAPTP